MDGNLVRSVGVRTFLTTASLVLGTACSSHPDEGTVVTPGTGVTQVPGGGQRIVAEPAHPIMGGTLTLSGDGRTAVASDPDRDAVFIVNLAEREVTPIGVEAGAVPGRIVMGSGTTAYVVLREAASVARIDLDRKQIDARFSVCDAPRGIAYDAALGRVHVACQGGALLSLDADTGELVRQIRVADDLRDVVLSGDHLVLTTFRSSEILIVDPSGQISQRTLPQTFDTSAQPSVAWRAVAGPGGKVGIVHQLASTNVGVGTGPAGYGENGLGPCSSSVVTPSVTTVTIGEDGQAEVSAPVTVFGAAGPTDIALSESGRVAVVVAGNAWSPDLAPVTTWNSDEGPGCGSIEAPLEMGEPVAVALDQNDRVIVQSREPAALYFDDGTKIVLSSESRANTGLALFHMNTGAGIACASCHAEGTDDGQTWIFSDIGPRRTQSVAGGVSQRAPFHWDGDMEDFTTLVDEVMVGRMSLPHRPNHAQLDAFLGWVDTVARPAPRLGDADAIARGEALFFERTVGCNDCHTGPALTNNQLADVGTGASFIVPSLVGVAARAPFIHDGCAPTLRDRFTACGGGDRHGKTSQLSESELDDLVSYLETL